MTAEAEDFKKLIMEKKADIEKLVKEQRENSVPGTFEISIENMGTLRALYDEHGEIFCPTQDTTFEQFCGYMIVAGTNFMQKKFVEFSMKKMFEDLLKE